MVFFLLYRAIYCQPIAVILTLSLIRTLQMFAEAEEKPGLEKNREGREDKSTKDHPYRYELFDNFSCREY